MSLSEELAVLLARADQALAAHREQLQGMTLEDAIDDMSESLHYASHAFDAYRAQIEAAEGNPEIQVHLLKGFSSGNRNLITMIKVLDKMTTDEIEKLK